MRTIALVVLGAFTLAVSCTTAQTRNAPVRRLPAGFAATHPGPGSATLLTSQISGRAGKDVLRQSFDALAVYFDERPHVVRAIESRDGSNIQVLFTASFGRQPVRGFADATTAGIRIFFDQPDRFAESLPGLTSPAGGPAAPVRLRHVAFPDGTGTINLPDNWRLVSTRNGVVMAEGPNGAIDFGLALQVYTPQAAAQYPMRPPAVAAYGDPSIGLQQLMPQLKTMQRIRIIERTPVQGWDGPAEYLHFQADYFGKPAEILAMVLEKPIGPGTWFFYYSQVRTPIGQFERGLPVLLEIWKSWKTDDRVFAQRLDQAMRSMQACSRIISEVNTNRQQAQDRSATAWSHYIRGTWPVDDTRTGVRYNAPNDVDRTIDELNRAEGYQRWRSVPYQDLNR